MGLRVAMFSVPAAYLLMAVWPQMTARFLHVLFITGFSLLTFVVASRVVLGHSGQVERFRARLWPVTAMTWLLVLAMATRLSADWFPQVYLSHLGYAAVCWALGVVIWAARILVDVRKADQTEG